MRHFRELVARHDKNPDAYPRPLEPELPRDSTLDFEAEGVRDEINAAGFVRLCSLLFDAALIPPRTSLLIEKRSALIVVAQVALLRSRVEGAGRMPRVM